MSNKKDLKKIIQAFSLITQLGLVMVANIGVALLLGYFLDNILKNKIIFKIIGIVLGVISGFYSLYRLLKNYIGDD